MILEGRKERKKSRKRSQRGGEIIRRSVWEKRESVREERAERDMDTQVHISAHGKTLQVPDVFPLVL